MVFLWIPTNPSVWLGSLTKSIELTSYWEAVSRNFPIFYGTRKFIALLTRARHYSLSWARSIQYIPLHPISLRSILIPFHLRLALLIGLSFWLSHQIPTSLPLRRHECYLFCSSHSLWIIILQPFSTWFLLGSSILLSALFLNFLFVSFP
jgi:hypothetical protein